MDGKNGMIVGIIVAAVVVIGGIVLLMGGDDAEDSTSNNTTNTNQTNDAAENEPVAQSTIVELAQGTESLSTLVAAVVEADLVATLNSEGPFTVFAPTNDAFAALLSELNITAEELLARDDLADILTYHVVAAKALSTDLSDGQELTTVQGEVLTVSINSDGVTLTDANGNVATVVSADIEASNGVVHVINSVVLPTL